VTKISHSKPRHTTWRYPRGNWRWSLWE